MVREVIIIPETATVLDACEFFTLHRLLSFPVVDAEHHLLGVVDIELYTSELADFDRSERHDDLFQLIGVHLDEARHGSPLFAFGRRFPWLLCNIAGGIAAAFLLGRFEAELKQVVALSLFIPVVLNLAESVSTQSVSLALQLMHGRRPTLRSTLGKLRSEIATGLLLGLASGGAIGLTALVWLGNPPLLLVLVCGIAGGMASSAVVGAAMPNLVRLARCDPRVAAGPIALASADVITLLIYCNFARWLLP